MNTERQCFWCGSSSNIIIIEEINFCKICFEEQKNKQIEYLENKKVFYPEINKITEKIYLGNEDGSREKDILKDIGITHILICAYGLKEYDLDNFIYNKLEIDDSLDEKLDKYLEKAVNFIDSAEKVYIHCQAGISRSASIVIFYLMLSEKLSYNDAKEFVRQRRPCINPNSSFESQLMKYEIKLKNKNYCL